MPFRPKLLKAGICPDCGGDLLLVGFGDVRKLRCEKCGKDVEERTVPDDRDKEIAVIDVEEMAKKMGTLKIRCRNCGRVGVMTWQLQTRRPDEPPTQFYKCLRCGRAWKESR
ncbi:MAG: RPA12/RPB9/RPC11 RNA polymerase family protein [Candidatus Undinarchaeales archaeon]|jgi:DNA-directed RNA polymerase subunit M|nr:RPA12/RPB9/RPC11 RNA polymerase family protein [Candidatus Undinarchaeales archaeon]MDP7492300.1 RPA12/RPB9/RPC11 RNA polymerase family protein [Candidatus Undinarchaeales archaeon]